MRIPISKKTSRKKIKALRRQHRQEKLIEFSKELNKTIPASEVWFREKFENESIERIFGGRETPFNDIYNAVIGLSFIADVANDGYKYIIEVDGSIHDTLKQAYKDLAKDTFYRRRGYKVFRVKAFDDDSYNKFLQDYKEYIDDRHSINLSLLYCVFKGLPIEGGSIRQQKILKRNKSLTLLDKAPKEPSIANKNGVILRKRNVVPESQ